MDLYNRYVMRSTGETQFQPQDVAEQATFAALDILREKGLLGSVFEIGSEEEKNSFMEDMRDRIQTAISVPV